MNRYEPIPPSPGEATSQLLAPAQPDTSDRVWARLLARRRSDRSAGPEVDWTPEEVASWSLYGALLTLRDDRPFLFAQVGQSLDGRVATPEGDARDISSQDGLTHLHRCRALFDAVVIGVGTALADDPQLTVRLADGASPARVIVDPGGRLDDGASVFRDDGARRIVIQCVERKRPSGVETVTLEADAEGIPPVGIMDALRDLGFRRVMIEGGGNTIGRFLDCRLIDRLHVSISPLIIGDGPSGIRTTAPLSLAEAMRPHSRVYSLGGDILFDCAFD